MIAAEMTGRTCIGLEISPAYVDVIVKRGARSAVGVCRIRARTHGRTEGRAPLSSAPSMPARKLINFNQVLGSPLALRVQNFARNPPGMEQAFIFPNLNGFNRPTNIWFGPDGCAYVVDYGAVRDLGSDSHFVGPPANGPLLQIPGTGVIWKICPM